MLLMFLFGGLAFIAFLIAMDTDSGFMLLVAIGLFVAALIRGFTYHDTPPPDPAKQEQAAIQKEVDKVAQQRQQDADTNDGAPADTNTSDDSDQNQAQADDQKQDDSKGFDWQKWADDIVKKNQIVSCTPDGIQVYVSGTQDTDNTDAGPSALAVWPRLHQDGKPFLCSEGKDPKEEPKR